MANIILCVVLLAVVNFIVAESALNKSFACCPSSHYILDNDMFEEVCWEPKSNTTRMFRFDKNCERTVKMFNYTLRDGEVEIPALHNASFDSTIACTGLLVKDMNLVHMEPVAVLCIPNELEDHTLAYCMIASAVFLAITAIIYSLFSELRDLFGKSIINFCICLAIGLGIFSIIRITSFQKGNNPLLCAAKGFFGYFFVITSFFWTNSISIQVLRDTRRVCTADYTWREFKWYALYSWGVPAILTTCMVIVNYHPGDHEKPGIGLAYCWFLNNEQQWYYMYSVMTILILVNTGIFIYISTMVWRHSFSSSHIKALKFKLSMTMRLFVVMGLPWIFEMIISLSESNMLWTILNVFNCLQGVFLFLVLVVFRKRVIRVMYKRGWLPSRGCSGLVERCLAAGDDAEENVIQHTDVPLNDNHQIKRSTDS